MKYILRYTSLASIFIVCIQNANAQIKINSGGVLYNNGASLTLKDMNLQNDGTVNYSGTADFVFNGSVDNSISGSGVTNFFNLSINKTNAKLSLDQNIKISGALSFSNGKIDLKNSFAELIYPSGKILNETENNRIFSSGAGEIFITQTLNNPAAVNPGNLGAVITSSQNMGTVTIRRGHQASNDVGGQAGITRYYKIEPTNNTNLNASLQFKYFDAELNNVGEAFLALYRKETTTWNRVGKDIADAGQNFIQKNGIASFSTFTLGKDATAGPLPLHLIAFTAVCKGQGAQLQWITANEVNTKQFVIEISNNGTIWQQADIVAANGNTQQHTYSAVVNLNASFFRLKMEDVDGKYTYSPVKKTDCSASQTVLVGPNPTNGNVTISATMNASKVLTITVVDMSGRMVQSKQWPVKQGLNSMMIDLYKQPSSTYLITVKGDDVHEMIKVVKQ